ncbi:MAG: hypothetical protein LAT54_08705, partial [Cryomorphaceae bacterium]|nr:hypothetical protein [Cryomorphaceae bacterium]
MKNEECRTLAELIDRRNRFYYNKNIYTKIGYTHLGCTNQILAIIRIRKPNLQTSKLPNRYKPKALTNQKLAFICIHKTLLPRLRQQPTRASASLRDKSRLYLTNQILACICTRKPNPQTP